MAKKGRVYGCLVFMALAIERIGPVRAVVALYPLYIVMMYCFWCEVSLSAGIASMPTTLVKTSYYVSKPKVKTDRAFVLCSVANAPSCRLILSGMANAGNLIQIRAVTSSSRAAHFQGKNGIVDYRLNHGPLRFVFDDKPSAELHV